jgi:hypothetical protein
MVRRLTLRSSRHEEKPTLASSPSGGLCHSDPPSSPPRPSGRVVRFAHPVQTAIDTAPLTPGAIGPQGADGSSREERGAVWSARWRPAPSAPAASDGCLGWVLVCRLSLLGVIYEGAPFVTFGRQGCPSPPQTRRSPWTDRREHRPERPGGACYREATLLSNNKSANSAPARTMASRRNALQKARPTSARRLAFR